ncbi:MAG: hypothetical protein IPG50_15520 [Myxococcales bacterium]|nr:hypothetical protein [Myxococcales bacterium]
MRMNPPKSRLRGASVAAAAALAFQACSGNDAPKPAALAPSADGGDAARPATAKRSLCVDGTSVDGTYPQEEYGFAIGRTLPNLSFDTAVGGLRLEEYFEPCAPTSRLLVLRVTAPWCGSCLWHAEHGKTLPSLDVGARLIMVDVLASDRDNLPPRASDLDEWQTLVGSGPRVAADPRARLLAVNPTAAPLPLYVLVDTKRMEVVNYLNDPDPEFLELRIRQELAAVDNAPVVREVESTKVDGYFYRNQWELLQDMKVPAAPPADATNSKADDPAAAALGEKLFSETGFGSAAVSCATCHEPGKAFASDKPVAVGAGTVDRNAPSVLLAAYSRWQFWDGRADSLWMQALGPLEAADEVASTRLQVGHTVFAKYRTEYEAIWGAMPAFDVAARFPASGKPGDASWSAMSSEDQTAATRVFVNVGKSIAAFERTLRVKPNRLDAYAGGDTSALTTVEKQGLFDFFVGGCIQCHFGPRLTNDAFHNVRFPTGRKDGQADRGRPDGVTALLAAEFNSASQWSDAQSSTKLAALENRIHPIGAFKTPTLRGVANTAPYGHGGSVPNLVEVTILYGKAGLEASDPRAIGTIEPWVAKFSEHHRPGIEAILNVLTGTRSE